LWVGITVLHKNNTYFSVTILKKSSTMATTRKKHPPKQTQHHDSAVKEPAKTVQTRKQHQASM
jgi:hypothetical protein